MRGTSRIRHCCRTWLSGAPAYSRCIYADHAQVAGHKNFRAIAVATDIKPGASPCGMCRQLYVLFLAAFLMYEKVPGSPRTACASSPLLHSRSICMTRMERIRSKPWARYLVHLSAGLLVLTTCSALARLVWTGRLASSARVGDGNHNSLNRMKFEAMLLIDHDLNHSKRRKSKLSTSARLGKGERSKSQRYAYIDQKFNTQITYERS